MLHRNNYEKKNASLTKDVKKLIIQLEKQAKSFSSNSVTKQINFDGIGDDNEALKKLRDENAQLSEELIRKSQSLVDALRALAEFHENPQDITKSITSNLSHANEYMYNNHGNNDNNGYERGNDEQKVDSNKSIKKTKGPSSYADVSNKLQKSMEQDMKNPKPSSAPNVNINAQSPSISASPPSSVAYGGSNAIKPNFGNGNNNNSVSSTGASTQKIVIGAKYGINDVPPAMPSKFGRFKNRFGNRMKEQISKMQQQIVTNQIQKVKQEGNSPTLNQLGAKSVIKESEKVLITKTKQQLNTQCEELQSIANELSSTIEQKEVILESLRFANTYLGKRVIALEKLMKMQPGSKIDNQDALIRDAINIQPDDQDEEKENERPLIQVNVSKSAKEEDDINDGNNKPILEINVSNEVLGNDKDTLTVTSTNTNTNVSDDYLTVDRVDVKIVESGREETPEMSADEDIEDEHEQQQEIEKEKEQQNIDDKMTMIEDSPKDKEEQDKIEDAPKEKEEEKEIEKEIVGDKPTENEDDNQIVDDKIEDAPKEEEEAQKEEIVEDKPAENENNDEIQTEEQPQNEEVENVNEAQEIEKKQVNDDSNIAKEDNQNEDIEVVNDAKDIEDNNDNDADKKEDEIVTVENEQEEIQDTNNENDDTNAIKEDKEMQEEETDNVNEEENEAEPKEEEEVANE